MDHNKTADELSSHELFRELDYEFIGLRKLGDETYTYKAIDVRVKDTLELPIIIQWPDSVINFEFTIKPTDVYFSIYFVAAPENDVERHYYSSVEIETVKDKEKVTCDEVTEGTYKPPCEGVVFFVWDNTHDWSAIKNVSYKIEVIEPSFKGMEVERKLKSKEILKDVIDDNTACAINLADASDRGEVLACSDKILTKQIQIAEETLARKTAELQRLRHLEKDLVSVINDNLEKIPGLCIRCLNRHLLSIVIGFLDVSIASPVLQVNKFWSKIGSDIRMNGPISGTDYKYLATAKMRPRTIVLDNEIDKLCSNSIESDNDNDKLHVDEPLTKTDENDVQIQKKKPNDRKKDYVKKNNHSDNEGESIFSDSVTEDSGDAYIKTSPRIDIQFPVKENSSKTYNNNRRVRVTSTYDVYPHLHPEFGHNVLSEKVNNDMLYERYLEFVPKLNSKKNKKQEITSNDDKSKQITMSADINEATIQNNDVIIDKKKEKDVKLPKVAESKTKTEKKNKPKKKIEIDEKNEGVNQESPINNDTKITTDSSITAANTTTTSKHMITRDEFIRIMDIAEPVYELIGML